jgi:hypothetical protein
MKKFLLFLFIFLTSCGTENPPQFIDSTRSRVSQEKVEEEIESEPIEFTVLFQRENADFARYEPSDGAYIGAWLMPDISKKMFEQITENRHAVYVNEMNLGDEIPVSWILHCIAAFATPLIIVHPPDNPELEEIPISDLTTYLAKRLGSFNLPIFVAFFPDETSHMMPAEYTVLFRNARNIFRTHAPMTAFVWCAPNHTSTPNNPFYPGHNVVDWVSLPLLSTWKSETGYKDILQSFEIFYESFHEYKPIMLLPLGVSHFTRGDYTYRLHETADEIKRVYMELQNFPRLGLIVYGDTFTLGHFYTDDFSVSIEKVLASAYREAISDEYFLHSLERTPQNTAMWVRARDNGYFFEDRIYISNRTLENELYIPAPRQRTVFDEKYFTESWRVFGKKITACVNRRVIHVENKP